MDASLYSFRHDSARERGVSRRKKHKSDIYNAVPKSEDQSVIWSRTEQHFRHK